MAQQVVKRAGLPVVLVPVVAGAAVAIALGVYGRVHEPTGVAINVAGFSSFQSVKTWLATLALVLGVVQVVSAVALYRGAKVGALHRWSGRLAVAVTLPVVAHCLYALGFQYGETRVLLHTLLGCFFYGVFVVKMLSLTRPTGPRWFLPVAGGVLFTALVGVWLTSALWFFTLR
jgi:hypothetical protein